MKEKKKAPIIYATCIMWARYDYVSCRTGKRSTRLVQLWQRQDGTLRLYFGTRRMHPPIIFQDVCSALQDNGWRLVAGGVLK